MLIYVSYVTRTFGSPWMSSSFNGSLKRWPIRDGSRFSSTSRSRPRSDAAVVRLLSGPSSDDFAPSEGTGERGLVESRRDGQFVYYRTRPAVLEEYMSELRRRMAVRDVGHRRRCAIAAAQARGGGEAGVTIRVEARCGTARLLDGCITA